MPALALAEHNGSHAPGAMPGVMAGTCTNGATGAECYRGSDCESGSYQNFLCT